MNYQSQPMQQADSRPMMGSLSLQVWGATDKGRQREGNEDAIYPESGAEFFRPSEDNLASRGRLLVVADGMGGTQAGSEASRWAIRVAVERYYDAPGANIGVNLRSAIEAANNSLYQYLRSTNVQQAGCTMTAAVIHGTMLHVANVGDSRVYLVRNGQITQLTRDHSVTQQKIDQGLIRPEDAARDPDRNVITRSMGTHPEVRVDLFPPIQVTSGDVVLLCSDGLTDMVSDAEIVGLVSASSPKRAAKRLITAANKRGGVDNISVVLAQIGGRPSPAAKSAKAHLKRNVLVRFKGLSGKQIAILGAMFLVLLSVLVGMGWVVLGGNGTPPLATATTLAPVADQTATPTVTPAGARVEDTPRPSGGPTSTPLPTRTPTLTPEPGTTDPGGTGGDTTVSDVVVQQLSPDLGGSSKNPVHFSWQGDLKPGQNYRLVTRHEASNYERVYPAQMALWQDESLPAEKAGEWLWWVQVVEGDRVIAESEHWHFYLAPLDVAPPVSTPFQGPDRPGSP